MTAEDKYSTFLSDINAIAQKYGYKCTFDDTFVFDSGFDMTIHVDDTTFEI